MLLYHGSLTENLEVLEPRMDRIESGKSLPRVWASDRPGAAAVCMLDLEGHRFGRTLVDLILGRFRLEIHGSIQDKKGSIYTVELSSFWQSYRNSWLYFNFDAVKVVDEIKVPSALEYAARNGVRIVRHPSTI